jgi:hypothetical protein
MEARRHDNGENNDRCFYLKSRYSCTSSVCVRGPARAEFMFLWSFFFFEYICLTDGNLVALVDGMVKKRNETVPGNLIPETTNHDI